MEAICKKCGESVSGPVEASVKAALARHTAKKHKSLTWGKKA